MQQRVNVFMGTEKLNRRFRGWRGLKTFPIRAIREIRG
jgi:hypothetical protein